RQDYVTIEATDAGYYSLASSRFISNDLASYETPAIRASLAVGIRRIGHVGWRVGCFSVRIAARAAGVGIHHGAILATIDLVQIVFNLGFPAILNTDIRRVTCELVDPLLAFTQKLLFELVCRVIEQQLKHRVPIGSAFLYLVDDPGNGEIDKLIFFERLVFLA